jgi:hypothetical protein
VGHDEGGARLGEVGEQAVLVEDLGAYRNVEV